MKGPEAARMNKKAAARAGVSIIAIPVKVCGVVCGRTWVESDRVTSACAATKLYTGLFENHFEADRWGESILGARRHAAAAAAATPTSRYHCSAASKLRRVHRLHTPRQASTLAARRARQKHSYCIGGYTKYNSFINPYSLSRPHSSV